nr:MAG TPA: hypothetical protein [Microviridae sp.]
MSITFRLPNTRQKYGVPQDFASSYLEDEWTWDDDLQGPRITGKIDTFQAIQSSADCALEKVLDRLCNNDYDTLVAYAQQKERNVSTISDDIADMTEDLSDLTKLGELYTVAEKYREEFGLSDEMSVKDIFEEVKKRSLVLKENLNKLKEAHYEKVVSQDSNVEKQKNISPSPEIKKEEVKNDEAL